MRRPWPKRDPEAFARETAKVRRAYPNLHSFPDDQRVIIRGGFPVKVGATLLDRFQLAVTVPRGYPQVLPVVRETGGRIPCESDRHIEADGKACLFLEEETETYFPAGSSLLDFLQGPVNAFFVGQLHFEQFGTWPFGQRSHGPAGVVEFYAEKLGTQDRRAIVAAVDYLRYREIKGHWPCPCGSGKRLRDCHMPKILALRRTIPPEVAERSYARLCKPLG